MNISSKTKILALLGKDISYSLSPRIHNFSAKALGLNYAYLCFDASLTDIRSCLRSLWELNIVGLNVTTPYKTAVATSLDNSHLTSVNTLYRKDNHWVGASTDGQGFASAIGRLGLSLSGFRKIVILGSGGAVDSILQYIAGHFAHFPEIVVLRRNPGRDADLRAQLPATLNLQFVSFEPRVFHDQVHNASGETLIIQATNAPAKGDDLSRFAPSLAHFSGAFADLTYGTVTSALLPAAIKRGIPCQDGLPMLIEQARLAQMHWWGQSAAYEDILNHLQATT